MTYFYGRCLHHQPRNKEYDAYVEPIGDPSALVCGLTNCDKPAYIWLDKEEQIAYENGERVFHGATNVVKVKAADSGLKKR
jgi:hypothetical protein